MSTSKAVLRRLGLFLLPGLLALGGAACDALLGVSNPGAVPETSLESEEDLPVVVDGVYGDLQDAFDDTVLYTALFTDELVHSGSFPDFDQIDRRAIPASNIDLDFFYELLSTARFTADRAAASVREILGAEAESSELLAAALAYGGYARILLADNFCQVTFDVGPPLSPAQVYAQAIDLFTQAIPVAEAAKADSLVNLSLVGRARARLNAGDLAGAAADASQVPLNFVFSIDYSENSDRQENLLVIFTIDRRETSVGEPFRNTGDPRVPVCHDTKTVKQCPFETEGELGPDNQTPLFVQLKYLERSSDIRLASGTEAALIAREAAGENVAQERAFEFWLEGHRLADMRRRDDPFLEGGEACFPFPEDELDANPNL